MTEDCRQFSIRIEFFKCNKVLAARIDSKQAWIDLDARKLMTPPEELKKMIMSLPKSDDFHVIPPLKKKIVVESVHS